jgi:hypothetical protein
MNVAETRAELIDPLLVAAGWGVVEGSRIRREFPIAPGRIEGGGRRGKSLSADYVLSYRNTALAVVEAKADSLPLTEGVGQAKEYAAKLQLRFTYASNGKGIYAIDRETGEEGEAEAFPSPQELWQRTFAEENAWRDQQHFLNFVLQHDVTLGVQELALEKLTPLLQLRFQFLERHQVLHLAAEGDLLLVAEQRHSADIAQIAAHQISTSQVGPIGCGHRQGGHGGWRVTKRFGFVTLSPFAGGQHGLAITTADFLVNGC